MNMDNHSTMDDSGRGAEKYFIHEVLAFTHTAASLEGTIEQYMAYGSVCVSVRTGPVQFWRNWTFPFTIWL